MRHFEPRIDALRQKYEPFGIEVQKDFSSNKTVYMADLLVTDWSSIAFKYAFSTLKPVLFINTPMKIINPDYQEFSTAPVDLELRSKVGVSIEPENIEEIATAIEKLLHEEQFSKESMADMRAYYVYNVGTSGRVGAKYIIDRLVELSKQK